MRRKRIVVDTNIIVSAFLGSKMCSMVFQEIIAGRCAWLTSEEQLEEIRVVLLRPKFTKIVSKENVERLINAILCLAELPVISVMIDACRDKKDNYLLEIAVAGKADCLISGDNDLLELDPFEGIRIIQPRSYIDGTS